MHVRHTHKLTINVIAPSVVHTRACSVRPRCESTARVSCVARCAELGHSRGSSDWLGTPSQGSWTSKYFRSSVSTCTDKLLPSSSYCFFLPTAGGKPNASRGKPWRLAISRGAKWRGRKGVSAASVLPSASGGSARRSWAARTPPHARSSTRPNYSKTRRPTSGATAGSRASPRAAPRGNRPG